MEEQFVFRGQNCQGDNQIQTAMDYEHGSDLPSVQTLEPLDGKFKTPRYPHVATRTSRWR
jgi:hypothetical protein